MDKGFSQDCVDLEAACKVLALSQTAQKVLRDSVGDKDFPVALEMMRSGELVGDLGATVHDLFLDLIGGDANAIWSGFIRSDGQDFPVEVNEYHGVFWVWALEVEPVGYFLDADAAINFVLTNWDDVYQKDSDPNRG